ncbi:hypothetical protein GCM10028772_42840 [Nocardioides ultimimeridianus]
MQTLVTSQADSLSQSVARKPTATDTVRYSPDAPNRDAANGDLPARHCCAEASNVTTAANAKTMTTGATRRSRIVIVSESATGARVVGALRNYR